MRFFGNKFWPKIFSRGFAKHLTLNLLKLDWIRKGECLDGIFAEFHILCGDLASPTTCVELMHVLKLDTFLVDYCKINLIGIRNKAFERFPQPAEIELNISLSFYLYFQYIGARSGPQLEIERLLIGTM